MQLIQNTKKVEKLEIIEVLRGLAALAVTWFHLTNGNPNFLNDGWIKSSGHYGWLGVEVFFVLSGFIIPYSLWRSNFRLRFDWKKFFLKRAIRLYPAYLISILLIILLWYASSLAPNFQGEKPNITLTNILLHIGFLNGIFNESWLSPVFWTLGIEFQYYLFIIFIYPLLTNSKLIIKMVALLVLCILPFIFSQGNLIFSWLLLFNFGIIAFQITAKKITLSQYLSALFVLIILSFFNRGILLTSIGFITSIAIVFIQIPKIIIFSFLGEISYSLYLLHVPIGGRVINLSSRIGQGLHIKILSLIFALGISVLCAYLMYKYVEKPVQKYFKTMKYVN